MPKQNTALAKEMNRDVLQIHLLSYENNRVQTNSLYFIEKKILLTNNQTKGILSCMQTLSKIIQHTPSSKYVSTEVHRVKFQKCCHSTVKAKRLDPVLRPIPPTKDKIGIEQEQSTSIKSSTVQSISLQTLCIQTLSKTIQYIPSVIINLTSERHRVNTQTNLLFLENNKVKSNSLDLVLTLCKQVITELKCIQTNSMKQTDSTQSNT